MADTGTRSGGGVSSFLTYSYHQMKEMAYADDPDEIAGHAAQWAQAARDLRIFQQMLQEEMDSLAGVYSSAAGAPALMRAVSEKASKIGDIAGRFERSSSFSARNRSIWPAISSIRPACNSTSAAKSS